MVSGTALLLMTGIAAVLGLGRRRKVLLVTLIILASMLLFVSCGGGSSSSGGTPASDEITYSTTGLNAGATYYWKVTADDGKGGSTASDVWSFTTQ